MSWGKVWWHTDVKLLTLLKTQMTQTFPSAEESFKSFPLFFMDFYFWNVAKHDFDSKSELDKILILMGPTFTYYAFLTKLTKSRKNQIWKSQGTKVLNLTLFQLFPPPNYDQALLYKVKPRLFAHNQLWFVCFKTWWSKDSWGTMSSILNISLKEVLIY